MSSQVTADKVMVAQVMTHLVNELLPEAGMVEVVCQNVAEKDGRNTAGVLLFVPSLSVTGDGVWEVLDG